MLSKIFIGADHRGYNFKKKIINLLERSRYQVVDMGTYAAEPPCDYPKISYDVAQKVASAKNSRGILICMTGIGHTIAANKVPGAYAALCYSKSAAILSRRHNNANILVLGAKFVSPKKMPGIIKAWLNEKFEGGRHLRRVRQIREIEMEVCHAKSKGQKSKVISKKFNTSDF